MAKEKTDFQKILRKERQDEERETGVREGGSWK